MTRNLKVLGLALVAVLAMSALAVSAASAAVEHTFKSGVAKTIFTAEQEGKHKFTIGAGSNEHTTECEKALFEGTEEGATRDTITVTPTYTGCNTSGLGAATVKTNHCAYVLESDTSVSTPGEEHAPVEIECSGGSVIEVQIPSVATTLKIGAQKPTHGVRYDNVLNHGPEKKEAVKVTATVKGISYSCSGFGCFALEGGGSGTNGTYSGTVTATGFEDLGVSCGTGTEKTTPTQACLKEGKQVDVTMTTP